MYLENPDEGHTWQTGHLLQPFSGLEYAHKSVSGHPPHQPAPALPLAALEVEGLVSFLPEH